MREEESPAEQDRENELLGPKTAEVPESETLPSSDLTSFLDISSEAPPETQSQIKELIKSYKDTFSFDNWLGNMLIEVQIDTIPKFNQLSIASEHREKAGFRSH